MDDVILLFPSGQTSTGRRVKKVTKAQAAAVRTLARTPSAIREILLRMVNEWAESCDKKPAKEWRGGFKPIPVGQHPE